MKKKKETNQDKKYKLEIFLVKDNHLHRSGSILYKYRNVQYRNALFNSIKMKIKYDDSHIY